jgi:hypothetical protein
MSSETRETIKVHCARDNMGQWQLPPLTFSGELFDAAEEREGSRKKAKRFGRLTLEINGRQFLNLERTGE